MIIANNGMIFAAQDNEQVVLLNYEDEGVLSKLKFFNLATVSLKIKECKKANLAEEVISQVKRIVLSPFQNQYVYSMIDLDIDNTRHILYALGTNPKLKNDFIIQVYDLGPVGKEFKKVMNIKAYDLKYKYMTNYYFLTH